MTKPLIYDLDAFQLAAQVTAWEQPMYRAKQIWEGLYHQLWEKPEQFTTLSKELRNKLDETFSFTSLQESERYFSTDQQTTKVLFRLPDGQPIETVLMRYEDRRTLCISTQAGCAMGCVFCATGQMGFRRNLTSGEIVEQVLIFARELRGQGEKPTNVVLMGMGEPFHNYEATMAAIDCLSHPDGYNMGARRFTISTVGLIPAIRRFTAEKRQVGLAISLHASEDKLRSSMLPVNVRYPIKDLIAACHEYVDTTGRRITFEWALIQGVNDSPEEARSLARLLKGLNCHVNVIPLNPTNGYSGARSTRERVAAFRQVLEAQGISCTVRVRRGIDIHAGCGQLAGQVVAPISVALTFHAKILKLWPEEVQVTEQVVRLIYPPTVVNVPIVNQLIRSFGDLAVNILRAEVNPTEGWLEVQLIGSAAIIESSIDWLRKQGVEVQVLG